MLNTVYRLIAPRRFEMACQDISLDGTQILVRPTHMSICNADQRYYQGLREERIMKEKLPMALIHEAVGEVLWDPSNTFAPGARVVMIPNIPTEEDAYIAENYMRSSRFRASSCDGFMQEYVPMSPDRLLLLPDGMDDTVAAFTELVSVSVHAIRRFEQTAHARRRVVGVWGDGNLGYITALFLKLVQPETEIVVVGMNPEKLSDFTFADRTYTISDIPESLTIDHAFECVGGTGSGKAINQIIDWIQPEGTIAILGVSELMVPLNTRMILEKGLRVLGSSRSGRADFERTVEIYQKHPEVINYLANIVGAVLPVRSISDMKRAFELDIRKSFGKTIMLWEK